MRKPKIDLLLKIERSERSFQQGSTGAPIRCVVGGIGMDSAVEKALDSAQKKLKAYHQREKDEIALYFNLYEREYSANGRMDKVHFYYAEGEQPVRYFRKIPKPLTEEEFQQLSNMKLQLDAVTVASEKSENSSIAETQTNRMSDFLNGLGVLLLLGTIFMCISLYSTLRTVMSDPLGMIIGFGMMGIIGAVSLFVVATLLKDLREIRNSTEKISDTVTRASVKNVSK